MATPPWMPAECGNDAVLVKALGDRINELCHQIAKVEHDRNRYANRIAELDLLIQTAEEYAKAQDERINELEEDAKAVDARHAKVIEVWKKDESYWIEENRRYERALERIADLVQDTDSLGDAVSIAVEAMK